MDRLLKKIDIVDKFEQLRSEVLEIIKNVNLDQIMCQSTVDNPDCWTTGAGRVDRSNVDERSFCVINSALKGSILEYYIQKYNGYRTRIMIMPPRHCYSVHPDPTPRIHIPIITNKQAWMIWPYNNQCHQLGQGEIFWADTRKYHTFINGSTEKRIHIVMCVNN